MDIRPPRRRQSPVQSEQSSDTPLSLAAPESVLPDVSFATEADSATPPQPRRRIGKKVGIIFGSLLLVLAAAGAAVYLSYQSQLGPVNAASKDHVRITIVSGTTPAQIATLLHDKKLIQSTRVFDIYTRITQTRHKLQAGSYSLSPAQSLSEIVDYLVSGKADQFKITFYTGGTLQAAPGADDSKKTDVETMLLRAGFSQADVSAALAASYASPLFAGRPAGASLEGYVYGDTYLIDGSTTVTQLLTLVFKTYNDAINDTDILAGLEAQGLNLYEGITLASIVQAEMGAYEADMPQVAQVFLKRLRSGMPLGSDVTAYYGADKIGAKRAVTVDTPYNTRIHAGLPPGPVGAPGLAALKAVAYPATGEYLYFLSGDDGTTHFALDDAGHEANKVHCKKLCAMQ